MHRPVPVLLPEVFPVPTRGMRLAGVLGGLLCVGLIFSALALTQKAGTPPPPTEIYVARQVSLPLEAPPPPPTAPSEAQLVPLASAIQLEIAATASPVRIQVPEMPQLVVDRAPPLARPGIVARFDLAKSAVRPKIGTEDLDSRRVFERGDVDQRPMVLQRTQPRISCSDASAVETPQTTMLLVVNTDGTVGEVQLLKSARDADFDQSMMEMIKLWKFSPAIRKGRKVRCWVQQTITVQVSGGSYFETTK